MNIKMTKCKAFTLIEVLVAVVILGIGLLGIASLQITTQQNNHSAYLRSQATVLAYDLADRMRANLEAVNNGDYDNPTATEHVSCNSTSACSNSELAEHDYYQWQQQVASVLPQGQGSVCIDATPGNDTVNTSGVIPNCDASGTTHIIKVWWTDDRSGVPLLFEMSFRP